VIASVAFQKFKALRNTSLRLAPFNLVIGPNGSGKTSLIESLLQLRALSKLPPADLPGASPPRTGGPRIDFGFLPPHEAIHVSMVCISDLRCDALIIEPPDPPDWSALKRKIGRIRAFRLDHYAMAEPSPRADGRELAPDGRNLAAVLADLRERSPGGFAHLTAEILRLTPEFSGIDFAVGPGETVTLGLVLGDGGAVVAADGLSQGTLYLLAMLSLAFDPTPPAVVCIEEIDRGVHPRMLREIRDTLYRLSYPASFGLARAPVQVIATTHSPFLLDLFRDHPEEVVITHKRGAVGTFQRLADRADLAELMQEGSLGDMWFSGILGGVPGER
jgi:predicted ATPase